MSKSTVHSLLSWGNEKPLLTRNPLCDHRGLLWRWQSLRMKTTWISEVPLEGKCPAEWTEQQRCFICKWPYFGVLSQWDLFLITAKPSPSWLIQNWNTVIPSSGNKILLGLVCQDKESNQLFIYGPFDLWLSLEQKVLYKEHIYIT